MTFMDNLYWPLKSRGVPNIALSSSQFAKYLEQLLTMVSHRFFVVHKSIDKPCKKQPGQGRWYSRADRKQIRYFMMTPNIAMNWSVSFHHFKNWIGCWGSNIELPDSSWGLLYMGWSQSPLSITNVQKVWSGMRTKKQPNVHYPSWELHLGWWSRPVGLWWMPSVPHWSSFSHPTGTAEPSQVGLEQNKSVENETYFIISSWRLTWILVL